MGFFFEPQTLYLISTRLAIVFLLLLPIVDSRSSPKVGLYCLPVSANTISRFQLLGPNFEIF